MAQLPPVGGTVTLAGVPQFTAAVAQVNSGVASIGAAFSRLGGQVGQGAAQLGRGFSQVSTGATGAAGGVGSFLASLNPLNSRLASSVASVTTFVIALQAAHTVITAVGEAVKQFGGGAAIDFQAQFAAVDAFSQGTTAQLDALRKQVLDLGRELPVSFEKINEASAQLGKAGQTAAEQLAGSLRAAITLIVASQNELSGEAAAGTITTALAAFRLGADQAQRVADTIAAVVQTSRLSFNEFRDSFSALGALGSQLGFSLEDTAAAIGIVADQGIKGSTAGTALRSAFQQLLDPSKDAAATMAKYGISLTAANGSIVTFRQFLQQLTDAFGKNADGSDRVTAAVREQALAVLFDSRAVTAIEALIIGGTAAFDDYTDAINRLTATDLAAKFAAPVQAQFQVITQNVQAVAIAVGSVLLPIFEQATARIAGALRSIDLEPLFAIGEAVRLVVSGRAELSLLVALLAELAGTDIAQAFAGVATAVQAIGGSVTQVTDAIGRLVSEVGRIATEGQGAAGFVGTLQQIAVAAQIAANVISGIIDIGVGLLRTIESNTVAAQLFRNVLLGLVVAPILALVVAFGSLLVSVVQIAAPILAIGAAIGVLATVIQTYDSAARGAQQASADLATSVESIGDAVSDAIAPVEEVADTAISAFDGVTAAAEASASDIGTAGAEIRGSFDGVAASAQATEGAFEGAKASATVTAQSFGQASAEIVEAVQSVGIQAQATAELTTASLAGVEPRNRPGHLRYL